MGNIICATVKTFILTSTLYMNEKDGLRKATGNFIPSVLTTTNETLYRQEKTRAKTITGYSACPFGECHARNLDEDFVGSLFCGDV